MPEIHLTPEQIFVFANYGVLPFWALLVFAPTLKLTDLVVHWPRPTEPYAGDPSILEQIAD